MSEPNSIKALLAGGLNKPVAIENTELEYKLTIIYVKSLLQNKGFRILEITTLRFMAKFFLKIIPLSVKWYKRFAKCDRIFQYLPFVNFLGSNMLISAEKL